MSKMGNNEDGDANSSEENEENALLGRLGYRQELYRGLDGIMSFAIGYAEVSVLTAIVSVFTFGLVTGGAATMVWGWIGSGLMSLIVVYCLAELCCAYPTAGSVYYWSGQLAPRQLAPFWSYWTGVANWLGNVSGCAAYAVTFAYFFDAAWQLSGYDACSNDIIVLISIIAIFLWSSLCCIRIDSIGFINNFAALTQAGTTLLILFTCFILSPKLNSAEYVFTSYHNETGFSDPGYVVIISLLFSLYSYTGYEAASHLAEETAGGASIAPRGMVYSLLMSMAAGLVIILALLFAMQDITAAINSPYNNAAIAILQQSLPPLYALSIAWLITISTFFSGITSVTVATRMTFALVRDKATPYHETLAYVHPTLKTPIYATFSLFIISALIQLLLLSPVLGTSIFESIVSLCTVGFQISYLIPISLKYAYMPGDKFPVTEMSLGDYSDVMCLTSIVWLSFTTFTFLLPTVSPITAVSMNYTCVMVGIVIFLGWLNWECNSKHTFAGPRRCEDFKDTDDANPRYSSVE